MKARIVCPEAHGAIVIDFKNENNVVWLARRWISGERQTDMARSMRLSSSTPLSRAFYDLICKYCPDRTTLLWWGSRDLHVYGDDRKPLLLEAIKRRFSESVAV